MTRSARGSKAEVAYPATISSKVTRRSARGEFGIPRGGQYPFLLEQ
jgi:hypothetical protein